MSSFQSFFESWDKKESREIVKKAAEHVSTKAWRKRCTRFAAQACFQQHIPAIIGVGSEKIQNLRQWCAFSISVWSGEISSARLDDLWQLQPQNNLSLSSSSDFLAMASHVEQYMCAKEALHNHLGMLPVSQQLKHHDTMWWNAICASTVRLLQNAITQPQSPLRAIFPILTFDKLRYVQGTVSDDPWGGTDTTLLLQLSQLDETLVDACTGSLEQATAASTKLQLVPEALRDPHAMLPVVLDWFAELNSAACSANEQAVQLRKTIWAPVLNVVRLVHQKCTLFSSTIEQLSHLASRYLHLDKHDQFGLQSFREATIEAVASVRTSSKSKQYDGHARARKQELAALQREAGRTVSVSHVPAEPSTCCRLHQVSHLVWNVNCSTGWLLCEMMCKHCKKHSQSTWTTSSY